MVALNDRLDYVLGAKPAAGLARFLNLHTVGDLLRHYPRRYAVRGEMTAIKGLAVGEHVTVLATVKTITSNPM